MPELDPELLRSFAQAAVEWMIGYLQGFGSEPILQPSAPWEVIDAFAEPLPEEGLPPEEVLSLFRDRVVRYSTHLQHPGNFAYIPNSTTIIGAIADALAATLNQNVSLFRGGPSAAVIEQQVVRWIQELLGYPKDGDGVLTSGGSLANLMGLALARAKAGAGDLVFYLSPEVHSSILRGFRFLGVGSEAIRLMKTDIYYRLDPAPLAEMVAWDRRRRRKPAVVVASAGTVSSGAVDPLEELADLCAEEGMWLHVDGAYGALAAAAPSGAWMRPALARADSLSLDPHKWLFVPIDTSCLLVRDPDHLRRFFSLVPEYLKVSREETPEDISHPMEKTIELTRRFRALRIWMTLKVFGATAIRRTIEAHLRMARKFASWVEASPRYQLLAPVMTSNVCLRRIPASLARPGAAGRERELERLNQEIIDRLNRGGGIFLSHCRLGGRFALRVCITHLRTGEEDIIRLWNRLEEVSLEAESELRAPPSR